MGGGREAQEEGDIYILMADSCWQKPTQHSKAEVLSPGMPGRALKQSQEESPQSCLNPKIISGP